MWTFHTSTCTSWVQCHIHVSTLWTIIMYVHLNFICSARRASRTSLSAQTFAKWVRGICKVNLVLLPSILCYCMYGSLLSILSDPSVCKNCGQCGIRLITKSGENEGIERERMLDLHWYALVVCRLFAGPLEAHEGWGSHQSGNEGRAAVKRFSARNAEKCRPIMGLCTSVCTGSIRGHASLTFKSGAAQTAPAASLPTALLCCVELYKQKKFVFGIFINTKLFPTMTPLPF